MKGKNQEATKQGFMSHAIKSAKEVWEEIQEMASDAWDKHKKHSGEEK